jgi:hypothetical protein
VVVSTRVSNYQKREKMLLGREKGTFTDPTRATKLCPTRSGYGDSRLPKRQLDLWMNLKILRKGLRKSFGKDKNLETYIIL